MHSSLWIKIQYMNQMSITNMIESYHLPKISVWEVKSKTKNKWADIFVTLKNVSTLQIKALSFIMGTKSHPPSEPKNIKLAVIIAPNFTQIAFLILFNCNRDQIIPLTWGSKQGQKKCWFFSRNEFHYRKRYFVKNWKFRRRIKI